MLRMLKAILLQLKDSSGLMIIFAVTIAAGVYVYFINRYIFDIAATAVFILLLCAIGFAFFRGVIR